MRKNKLFWLLLFLSPGFWVSIIKPENFFNEVANSPVYFQQKLSSYNSFENIDKVNQLRWVNHNDSGIVYITSKFFYNKLTYISNDVLGFLDYLSPRNYFLEAILFPLFPVWLFGLLFFIKKKKYKFLLFILILNFILFFAGPPNAYILFPNLIIYIYISAFVIDNIKDKTFKRYLLLLIIFSGLYLDGRYIFLHL